MITKCPVCGKRFAVTWPKLWAYKRETAYLCSYNCMRVMDKGDIEMKKKITEDMIREAVRIALDGGEVYPYLLECGSKNPSAHWALIKKNLMKTDPETYEELAKMSGEKKRPQRKPAADVPTVKIDGPIRIETPEANQVTVAEIPEKKPAKKPAMEYRTTGISTEMGEFRYFRRSGYIDWDPVSDLSTTVSLNVDEWRQLIRDMPEVMRILGVEA